MTPGLAAFRPPGPALPAPAAPPPPPATGGRATGATGSQATGTHRQSRLRRLGIPAWWPLAVVLSGQALLSLRLLRTNTAAPDEAISLWAGHLLWSHWLHGTPVPPFEAYLSGAPVIYPPLGALADGAAGLAAARGLSLLFLLGATALLWGTTGRLFGRRAAFFAAALFAVTGPVLQLGAFATGDAMSLFLVALAAWCVVRAGTRDDATGWMIAAGIVLALANATAYWSAPFDLVVLAVTPMIACPEPGGKQAAGRAATLLTVLATLVTAATLIGGGYYVTGIHQALSLDVTGMNPALAVLRASGAWLGVIAAAAVAGVAIGARRRHAAPRTWLLAVLTAALVIVPAEQAGLRTALALNVHVIPGAWFAAAAAGHAVDAVIAAVAKGWTRTVAGVSCVTALALPLSLGISQSWALATAWPDASSLVAIFGPLAGHSRGHMLVEDPQTVEYYLPAGAHWQRWSTTRNIVQPSGASVDIRDGAPGSAGRYGPGEFARYIASGYFSLVALDFADTTAVDHRIQAALRANRHYHVIDVVPYGRSPYVIWQYQTSVARQQYEPRLGAPAAGSAARQHRHHEAGR